MAGTVKRISTGVSYSTLQACYNATGHLTQNETFEIDTPLTTDNVGYFWSNGAFENISNYTLTIKGKDGVLGNIKADGNLSSVFIENMNNVILQDLNLTTGGLANLRLKNCKGIYAKNVFSDGANYGLYAEGCYACDIELNSINCIFGGANINSCPIGFTLKGSCNFASSVNSANLIGVSATNVNYLNFIGYTSLSSKLENHFKISYCKNVKFERCTLENAKGHAIYAINSQITVNSNKLWNNGLITNTTAAIFCEASLGVIAIGNTIKHYGSPAAYALFCRDLSKGVYEFYNNIAWVENVSGTSGEAEYLRLELDPTVQFSDVNIDYNLYYSSNSGTRHIRGNVGGLTFNYQTLAAFQTAQSRDLNSYKSLPVFNSGTFVLTSSAVGSSVANASKGSIYTNDLKVRTANPDIGAFDRLATTLTIANITPGFTAVDMETGTVYSNAFTIPAYNDVLFISNNNGFPDQIIWDITGLSTTKTIGHYKLCQWQLDSGFGAQYNVVITAVKTGFANSVGTNNNYVTVIKRFPVPKMSLSTDNMIYLGDAITLNNESIASDSSVWNIKNSVGTVINTFSSTNVTAYTFASIGVYTVELISTNTTGVRTAVFNNIIQVTNITISPKVGFTVNKEIVRKGLTVTFTNQSPDASSHSWKFPGGTPSVSSLPNPIITYDTLGAFDVEYTAVIGAGSYTKSYRRIVTVVRPLTTTGTTHVITGTGSEILIINGSVSGVPVLPGDIIKLVGSFDQIRFQNIIGTDQNPIIITNQGYVTIHTLNGYSAFRLETNCSNVIVDGLGDSNYQYGIKLSQPLSNTNGSGLFLITTKSTKITAFGLEIDGAAFAGIMAKTDDAGTPRSAFTQRDTIIHHNYLHNIRGEGMYLGHFTWAPDNGVAPGYQAPELWDTKVYRNYLSHTGNDGIQLGCGTQGSEIHDNRIEFTGENGSGGQNSCISVNTGFAGYVYNNKCIASPKGVATVIQPRGNTYIFNNTFSGVIDASDGIYIISGVTTGTGSELLIFNNTVLSRRDAVVYNYQGGEKISKILIQNNIFTKGVGGSDLKVYPGGTSLNVIMDKNIIKQYGDTADLYFYDEAKGDLRIGYSSTALTADGYNLNNDIILPWSAYLINASGLKIPAQAGWTYGAFSNNSPNFIDDASLRYEGVEYKIYCTSPDGWQRGTALSPDTISRTVAPENPVATVSNIAPIITNDKRNKTPFPTSKYEAFGKKGDFRYSGSVLAVCVQDNVWINVPRTAEAVQLLWNSIVGKPESTPAQLDFAALNVGKLASYPVDGSNVVDKVKLIFDNTSKSWIAVPSVTSGTKIVDESAIGNNKIQIYDSTLQVLKYIDLPVAGTYSVGTGTVLSFSALKIHGTPSAALTGNITFNLTSAIIGTKVVVFHKNGTAPSIPSIGQLISGTYSTVTSGINRLEFQYIDDYNIQYTISQVAIGAAPDPVTSLTDVILYLNAEDMSNSTLRVATDTYVTSWASPTGFSLVPATAPAQVNEPKYYPDGGANNRARVVFTSASSNILPIAGNIVKFGDLCFWIVFKMPTAVNNCSIFDQNATSTGDQFITYLNGTTTFTQRFSFSVNNIGAFNSNWNVLKITHNGTTENVYLNGSLAFTTTRAKTGFGVDASLALGGKKAINGTLSAFANLEVAKVILCQNINTANQATIDENLRVFYNLY